jgi:hypothetical protein
LADLAKPLVLVFRARQEHEPKCIAWRADRLKRVRAFIVEETTVRVGVFEKDPRMSSLWGNPLRSSIGLP